MAIFSTTHHHHTKTVNIPYEKTVTIHEHKAPTDESIRLLNEMQENARENIITSIKIDNNIVNGVAVYFRDDAMINRMCFYIKFNLNGKDYMIRDYMDGFEWHQEKSKHYGGLGEEAVFKALYKKFSEMIAEELIEHSMDVLKKLNRNGGRK